MLLIAQITDLHVGAGSEPPYRGIDTAAHLEAAVAAIGRERPAPDLVLVSGDLGDVGTDAEYERVRGILGGLAMPYYVVPGNHDQREPMRRVFAADGYLPSTGFLQYGVDAGALRLLALDTHVPGKPYGLICEERRGWFARELAAAKNRPVMVFMHHPPFATGMWLDWSGCREADALAAVIARHPNVERVLCGHLHRPITRRWAGTIGSVCPGVAHQIGLDLDRESGFDIVLEPPAYQLHVWMDTLGLVSHTRYVTPPEVVNATA